MAPLNQQEGLGELYCACRFITIRHKTNTSAVTFTYRIPKTVFLCQNRGELI